MIITVGTITPVYAGEKYLRELVKSLSIIRQQWEDEKAPVNLYESIFVVDGAIDDSLSVIQSLAQEYTFIKVIELSRNYGQHAATAAGICHSVSDWVVTLDEDLQHQPREIKSLFEAQVASKADVVYALPTAKVHGNSWRDFTSRLTKKVIALLTRTPQITSFNSFRLIRGGIARAAASSSSSQTYLDIALTWFTKSYASCEIYMKDERYQKDKSSGYGFLNLAKHAKKLIFSSDIDVASYGMILGLSTIAFSFLVGLYAIGKKIFFPDLVGVDGWVSVVVLSAFLSGVVILLLCIVLEYVKISAINRLGKPTFFSLDRSGDSILANWFK